MILFQPGHKFSVLKNPVAGTFISGIGDMAPVVNSEPCQELLFLTVECSWFLNLPAKDLLQFSQYSLVVWLGGAGKLANCLRLS